MARQKFHRDRVYQIVGEPGPGSIAVGYVRYSSELQDPATIVTQKRRITEFAEKKGWKIVRWYEEPEQSAKYEDIEDRPVFAQLLEEVRTQRFQVVLCYMNNRWSRNVAIAYSSLSRLRRLRVWWATADGLWDIDRVQQDGFDIAFAVDTQMNASYVRQLSKRTIDGWEDRAREGYHVGYVPFGYLPPEYPKAPDHAPSTWRPPRMPVRPNPVTFPALVRIGELAAQGWSDSAIADELDNYISRTPRFGERHLSKDTIASIRRSWFPREFAPGCGYGTIETPSGELVEGKHQAAWPYDLWQRMIEVKAGQYRRPRREAQRRVYEFSRIIVCAACRRPLRIGRSGGSETTYYKDTSAERKLDCAALGILWVKNATVVCQFGDVLGSFVLPPQWREAIAERCRDGMGSDDSAERIRLRRVELEAEQERLMALYVKGYISEEKLDTQMEPIRAELFTLPVPVERTADEMVQAALSVGETFSGMADYWMEATLEERRDIVWSLLTLEGLIYDLERRVIVGLVPRPSVLPVLALGLESTGQWEQREAGLWLRSEYLPPKLQRDNPHFPPAQLPSLVPAQQEEALALIKQGMSVRRVARHFGVSHMSVHRLVQKASIPLQSSAKLTSAQQEEVLALARQGVSLRQIAKQFGVNPESVRRLVRRRTKSRE